MKGILKTLLVCLIAIVLILPIGIGVWTGLSNSKENINAGSSQNGEVEVGVSLSETELSCNIGVTKVLTATTLVNSDSYIYQWNTSDKKVATVKKDTESGKTCEVTTVGEGTVVITVNVIDKSQFKIVDSATCTVTVIDSNIQFSVSDVVISLDKGNTSTVTAKAPGTDAITWYSEDDSIATVENGVITAHKPGQVYIVAKSGSIEGKLLVKIYSSVFTLEDTKTVTAGSTTQIQIDGTVSDGAIWTSSDDKVVSVDQNGNITGLKVGMATIKVASVTDDLSSTCVVIVKGSGAEAFELASGKKAAAAANPKNWYFLCESNNVSVEYIPTMDNGLISVNITNIGTSGANFFYLRYQPDDAGDVIYKHTLYIYSGVDNAHIQINGKDTYLKAGYNRIEIDYTSSAPKAGDPYQIKFRSKGEFYVVPVFEEIGRIEKMTLSASSATLNTTDNKTITLTATVPGQNNPTIEWTSSNESVVTVVDGVITAVGPGSSMITAICGNYSATCLITVEGTTPVEGTELESGNKSATVASPGNWFYLTDGKSKVDSTPILDSDGNIRMSIINIDSEGKKYVYLRYQPQETKKYKVTITVDFTGTNGSVVDISGGDTGATSFTLNNGTNTLEFEFTSNSSNPFQMKFYAIGGYVVNVTFVEV